MLYDGGEKSRMIILEPLTLIDENPSQLKANFIAARPRSACYVACRRECIEVIATYW